MQGEKALGLRAWAEARACNCLRFDYRGHGESPGRTEDYVLSDWLDDACLMVERLAGDRFVLVGSSMGAWLALHVAEKYPGKVLGVITVAAATDFTAEIIAGTASPNQLESLAERGYFAQESRYDDGQYIVTARLIQDGQSLRMLDRKIEVYCPVYLNHGLEDPDVPWTVSRNTLAALASEQAELTLVKRGDHRLSSRQDLRRLTGQLDRILGF